MSTNLVRVRPASEHNLGDWLVLNFKGSPTIATQITSLCKGSTRPFLNLDILSRLLIRLAPLAEQERALAESERQTSIISSANKSIQNELRRADRLRQAVLRNAFEGKLVSQDPNDEPACVLLEHIRAERAAALRNKNGTQPRLMFGGVTKPSAARRARG